MSDMSKVEAQRDSERQTGRSLRMAAIAWALTAIYYFYQYALRSSPSVMMPQLSEAGSQHARSQFPDLYIQRFARPGLRMDS